MSFSVPTQEDLNNKIAIHFNGTSLSYKNFESLIEQEFYQIKDYIERDQIVAFSFKKGIKEAAITLMLLKNDLVGLNLSDDKPDQYIIEIINSHPIRFFYSSRDIKLSLTKANINYQHFLIDDYHFYIIDQKMLIPNKIKKASWCLLTSGSTKQPKIVLISRDNLNERVASEIQLFQINSQDNICIFLNLSHDLGLNQLLTAYQQKATIFLFKYIFFNDFMDFILRNKITGFTAVASFWKEWLNHIDQDSHFQSSLRYSTISGSKLSEEEEKILLKTLPKDTILYKTYGQTETFRSLYGIIGKNQYQGIPLPNVQLRLITSNNQQIGELVHSGAGTMLGYLDESPPVAEVMTGDIFQLHSNHEYQYLGRKDDMFKIKDQRFYPLQIEEVANDHANIIDCVAFYQNFCGQENITLIYQANIDISSKDLSDYLITFLPKIIVPTIYIRVESFPKLHSGKIDRKKIIDEIQSLRLNK